MTNNRIERAKSMLTSTLLSNVRTLGGLQDSEMYRQASRLLSEAWLHTERGELNASQLELVRKAIDDLDAYEGTKRKELASGD